MNKRGMYQDMVINKIYNIDFMSNNLEDESVDVCVTDPPYKLTSGGISGLMKDGIFDKSVYDNKGKLFDKTLNFKDWMIEVYRILKKDSDFYCMVNDKNLQEAINSAKEIGFKLHNVLVWDKGNYTPNRWYMKNCEFILYFYKGKARPINHKGSPQLERIKVKMGNRFHPTEKPIELMTVYIKNSSEENALILDPFMGSGTTALACIETNRNFIGFELDEKYYKIANERISAKYNE